MSAPFVFTLRLASGNELGLTLPISEAGTATLGAASSGSPERGSPSRHVAPFSFPWRSEAKQRAWAEERAEKRAAQKELENSPFRLCEISTPMETQFTSCNLGVQVGSRVLTVGPDNNLKSLTNTQRGNNAKLTSPRLPAFDPSLFRTAKSVAASS